MAREVRTFAEGTLRWVQASGTGGWATASGAQTGLIGFVQAGASFASAREFAQIRERGKLHHHKFQSDNATELTFTYLQSVAASGANPATASGASTPQVHMELRQQAAEDGATSGEYFQFRNGVMLSRGWTEAEEGNQYQETWRFLSWLGPTASGYIA
jgi:hypothetical protein